MTRGWMALAALGVLVVLNLIALLTYAFDKRRARRDGWRISEGTLLWWTLAGPLGAIAAIRFVRHKSSKRSYLWRAILVLIVGLAWQAALAWFVIGWWWRGEA